MLRCPEVKFVSNVSPFGLSADGPGIPATVPLAAAGRYVFSLSSNTMAENIYGAYRLDLRLSLTTADGVR